MGQTAEPGRGSRLRLLLTQRWDIAVPLLVTAAGLLALALAARVDTNRASFLQTLELRSLDARFLLRGARPHDSRIVIVGVDEKTLRKLGSFPIVRSAYAELVDRLSQGGASVVALDLAFPTPEKNSALEALGRLQAEIGPEAPASVLAKIRALERARDNDALFAAAMKRAGNVILGHIFLDRQRAQGSDPRAVEEYYNILWGQPFPQVRKKSSGRDFDLNAAWMRHGQVAYGVEPNIRLLADAAKSYGFFNVNADSDGILRRATLLVRYQDRDYFPSLDFQAAKYFEQISDQEIVALISENGLDSVQFGAHNLPTDGNNTVLVNYAGPYGTYAQFSLADVLDGTVPPDSFRGKIVLVGATALGVGDICSTPFSQGDAAYMGVEFHANTVDNLLHVGEPAASFLRRGSRQKLVDVAFTLLFGLGMGLVFSRSRPQHSTVFAILALLVFAVTVYQGFVRLGWWLSFVVPASVLVVNYAGVTSCRMIFEEREKRKIRKVFSQYISPGVIQLMERDPGKYLRVGGELKELTIMFSDIRSFTSVSEGMTPDELVSLLNEYLGAMTELVFQQQGTLDKYIGDALMAFWGSPYPQSDHASRACGCALSMRSRLLELNRKWKTEGRKQLSIGVGINTGPVNVGNIGSVQRLSWTVMGDNVNLASRLEGLNKEYRSEIVISESTYRQVRDQYVCRELDQIRVKGKQQAVGIYELLAATAEASSSVDLVAALFGGAGCLPHA